MKNQLEDFIRQNKAAFDDKEPAQHNWTKVSRRLFAPVSLWNSITVWRVAAVLLLGMCVYLAIPKLANQYKNDLVINEFRDIESFYIGQISEKVNQIEGQHGQETDLNGFTHDFQQLEAMYQVLKEEMKAHPGQKVKDALVLNLLIRIDLLNQQLHKIEDAQDLQKKQDNEETNA